MWRHDFIHTYKTVIFLLTVILLSPASAQAQLEKNNIYLFDCTGSMKSAGLWERAQQALDATITTQTSIPGSQFTIIPFGDNPYESIRFDCDSYVKNKPAIATAFDKWINEARYTHISDVLRAGFDKCDPNRENRIYLLTDGKPNGGDTPEKVAALISDWCAGHCNARLFYVALKEDVVPGEVFSAIDVCKDAYVVQCKDNVIPQIGDISSEILTNIEELATVHNLSLSLPGTYGLTATCSDSLFTAEIVNGKASGGKIPVKISARGNASPEALHQRLAAGSQGTHTPYTFTFTVSCDDGKYFIANPEVTVSMADHIQSRLTLGDGNDELDMGSASWHASFLWSEATQPGEVTIDLAPQFFNVTDPATCLTFKLVTTDGSAPDFTVYFNGELTASGSAFAITPGRPAVLRIVFNTDATEGKRYFTLQGIDCIGLDIVNNCPGEEFDTMSLRARYSADCNPLKTALLWILAILALALLVWIFVLRPIFYPGIRVNSIELTGPDGYYMKKRLRGASRAILTSRKRSQNIFSRLFTGRTVYIKAPHFTPELEIKPAKKRIRVRPLNSGSQAWDITPVATLSQYDKATVKHRSRPDTFNIEVS